MVHKLFRILLASAAAAALVGVALADPIALWA